MAARSLVLGCAALAICLLLPAWGWPIGMLAGLEQRGRTTEYFRPLTPETGLSLAFSEIPLLRAPNAGPRSETEINYATGYILIRTYYKSRRLTDPLALRLRTFTDLRSEGSATQRWRENVRQSLTKAQFQKHGAGLQWEIIKVPKSVRAILGEGGVGLQVNGYRRIEFSGTSRWEGGVKNTGSFRQSKFPSLDMKQVSRFTIKGNIGSKIHVSVDQDSKRESDLANRIQIRYKGDEDDVLQTVELGNTNLNLPNTRFVGYSQQIQGLFGVKATAKLGDLGLTMITSQEKGNTEKSRFTAGAKQAVINLRDYQYYERAYYDVGRFGQESDNRGYEIGRDSIIEFRLYKQGILQNGDRYSWSYIDPRDSVNFHPREKVGQHVHELEPDVDYFLEPNQFWIRLERQLLPNDLLACYMVVGTTAGRDTIGTLTRDTLALRLLKPSVFSQESATWDYPWRNVYYLGAQRLDYDEFQLDIYKGPPNSESDISNRNEQEGIDYLQIFGLDLVNSTGALVPDRRIDRRDVILDLYRGHLLFPHRTPFAPGAVVYAPNAPPDFRLEPQVGAIYRTTAAQTLRDSSQYYIRITTNRRTNQYSLGRVNILDGSETVTLNGRRLVKGADYQIDYELGQITFLNPEVTDDPNADLTIDFEYAPFITADKKSLFGARAEYAPSQNFQVGSTFLYKAQKSTDRQPKLGQEKSRSMIGEFDFSFSANPRWMTKMADAVPLVTVNKSANSTLRVSGEVARSMPNPNTDGKVYLDDFEGTKLSTELGRLWEYWTQSSVPAGRSDSARSRLIWYNPFYDFYVTDIYDRDIGRDRAEARTKVLVMRLSPDSLGSWGGIMRALPAGMNDQSRAQFLEIRLGTYGEVAGELRVDLGEISEDIDGDERLDEEDREVPGGRPKNGYLDEGEDVGVDGLPDTLEVSRDGRPYDPLSNPDPAGDNSFYNESDRENYEGLNGTQGNAEWSYRGRRPDTEDIDASTFLDFKDNYYSFSVDLINSNYLVAGSERVATRISSNLVFRTYRIPLWGELGDPGFSAVGDTNATLIRYARLWLDAMPQQAEVIIATLEIVENRWQAQSVSTLDSMAVDKRFHAEVISTEENQSYYSPPGVAGFYDRRSQAREKEQSLFLRFVNFAPGDTGWAVKSLSQVEDYTGYRYLQMFVHGDTTITRDTGIVSFVFRMGNSPNDYYEQRIDLDTGWSAQNEILFDVDQLTPLKRIGIEVGVDGVVERWSADSTYKVRGNPTLTQMRYFAIGITYKEGAKPRVSGEVWCDELRLTGVRRDQGTAARLSASADFADLLGVTLNSEYQSYSFRGLAGATTGPGQGVNLLNGATQTRNDANTRLSLNKFLPDSWRIQLPLAVKYTKDVSVPKLETGSDIVLTPELQERETTTNITHGVSLSESMQLDTKSWLAKMTVNAFSVQGAFTRQQTWSPRLRRTGESYSAGGKYGLSFQKLWPISPLIWTRYLFFPKKVWGTQLRLLPRSFQANGSLQRARDESTNALGVPVFSYSRRFRGQADWQLEPFSVLGLSYGFATERDLYDPELVRFSINPRDFRLGQETKFTQRLDARYTPPILSFLGPSVSYNANYTEDSDPKRYQDGTRSVGVNSRVNASASINFRQLLGGKAGRGRARTTGSDAAKKKETAQKEEEEAKKKQKEKKPEGKPKDEVPQPAPPEGKGNGNGDGNGNGHGDADPPNEPGVPDSAKVGPPAGPDSLKADRPPEKLKPAPGRGGFRPHAPLVWVLRLATSPLEPIKLSYAHDETRSVFRLLGRPSFPYRLGLSKTYQVSKARTPGAGRDRDSETIGDAYTANSVINLLGLLKVTTGYEYRRSTSFSTSSSRRTGRTFPKLSTSLGDLGKIKVLAWVRPLRWAFNNTSAKFDYSRTFERAEKLREVQADTVVGGWYRDAEETTDRFGASLRFTQNFKSGWKISADYSWSLTSGESDQFAINKYRADRQLANAIGFSTDYSLRAPQGVKFPLLKGLRLKSTLNVSLAVRLQSNLSKNADERGGVFTISQHRTSLEISPRANYSFSSNMKGGFQMSWRDQTDKAQHPARTSHTRQVSFWVEFTF